MYQIVEVTYASSADIKAATQQLMAEIGFNEEAVPSHYQGEGREDN